MKIEGKSVINGKSSMFVNVNQKDVNTSRPKDPEKCAVALAIMRENPEVLNVRVHLGRTYIEKEKCWERYSTPGRVKTEIVSFDRGGGFQTGAYKIPSPSRAFKLWEENDWKYEKISDNPNRTPPPGQKRVGGAYNGVRQRADKSPGITKDHKAAAARKKAAVKRAPVKKRGRGRPKKVR